MFPEKPKRSPEKTKRKRKRCFHTNKRLRIVIMILILNMIMGLAMMGWLYIKANVVPPPIPTTVSSPEIGVGKGEQLIILFDEINAISTQNSYSGTVQLAIRGTGQAAGTDWSDAFYQYTLNNTPLEEPITHHFDLEIDGERAIETLNLQDNPPPYNPNHQYTVYYALGSEPRPILFRISDSVVDDNTGHFEITVTQQ